MNFGRDWIAKKATHSIKPKLNQERLAGPTRPRQLAKRKPKSRNSGAILKPSWSSLGTVADGIGIQEGGRKTINSHSTGEEAAWLNTLKGQQGFNKVIKIYNQTCFKQIFLQQKTNIALSIISAGRQQLPFARLKWEKQERIRTMRGFDNIWVRRKNILLAPPFPNFARLLTPRGEARWQLFDRSLCSTTNTKKYKYKSKYKYKYKIQTVWVC